MLHNQYDFPSKRGAWRGWPFFPHSAKLRCDVPKAPPLARQCNQHVTTRSPPRKPLRWLQINRRSDNPLVLRESFQTRFRHLYRTIHLPPMVLANRHFCRANIIPHARLLVFPACGTAFLRPLRITKHYTGLRNIGARKMSSSTGSPNLLAPFSPEAHTQVKIPKLVYGTAWKKERTSDLVYEAIKSGFRAIDTAAQPRHYQENLVGEGIKRAIDKGIVTRAELHVRFTLSLSLHICNFRS